MAKSLETIKKRNKAEIDEKLSMAGLGLQSWSFMYEKCVDVVEGLAVVKSDCRSEK